METEVLDGVNGVDHAASLEAAVLERYGNAAQAVEACLCLPVSYDKALLKVIPDEILEKDYGCGDPSQYIRPGETVLDLGSGSGKACYIISQIVGAQGEVIGVDFNPPMLELARKYQKTIGDKIGYHNVEFRRGKIQDLQTNLDLIDDFLKNNPVHSVAELAKLHEYEAKVRREQPLIPDESIDVIVSNCVLNLVRPEDKKQLFAEMYRVLKRGGRIAMSDIVSDEVVPEHLAQDPDLWSACVSGCVPRRRVLARLRRGQISRHSNRRAAERSLSNRRGHRVPRHHGDRVQRQRGTVHRAQSCGHLPRPVETSGRRRRPYAWSAACAWRCATRLLSCTHRHPTPDSSFWCRHVKKWRWQAPVPLTVRAITNAIHARPRGWITMSRRCPVPCAGRIPIAVREINSN